MNSAAGTFLLAVIGCFLLAGLVLASALVGSWYAHLVVWAWGVTG